MNLRAMPAGALAPGRATQAGQVSKERGQTKGATWPSTLGVGRWANHPAL